MYYGREIKKNRKGFYVATSIGFTIGLFNIAANKHEGLNSTLTVTETKPNEIELQATTPKEIRRGINAALEMCKVKNIAFEQQAVTMTKVVVECKPGTLK